MATKSQKIKLGVFLIASVSLFILSLVLITGMEMWEDQDRYYIEFSESVSGLEIGAPVKLRGVDVGSVTDIRLDPKNVEIVKVFVSVEQGTPIKTDTKAFINMQGITGLKFIELAEGTVGADKLPPGSRIEAGQTVLEQLTGRASDIGLKVEKVLNNVLYITRPENRRKIDSILASTEKSVENLNQLSEDTSATLRETRKMVQENRKPVNELIVALNENSRRANTMMDEISATSAETRQSINQMKLGETVAGVRETNTMIQERLATLDVGNTMKQVAGALDTFRVLLTEVTETLSQNQDQFRATMYNLRMASESLKEFSRSLESKPSRLIFDEEQRERNMP
jgi:phospholipid/cholesterol/gamma-HCH transport system substrate-binding protein